MIAESRPPRYAWIVALLACVAFACLTFTRAAETPPAPGAAAPEPQSKASELDTAQKILLGLKQELSELDEHISAHERMLDDLRRQAGTGREWSQLISVLEKQRLDARTELTRIQILRNQMKQQAKNRLVQASLLTNTALQGLLESSTKAEQVILDLSVKYSREHPEVASAQKTLDLINRQIDEQIQALLVGLDTQLDMAEERSAILAKELDEARHRDLEASSQQRPYAQLQRSLHNLQEVRDRLHKRILIEQINLKLPASAKMTEDSGTLRGGPAVRAQEEDGFERFVPSENESPRGR